MAIEENRDDLIKIILESDVIESEDDVRLPVDYSLCFFCQESMREVIDFKFVLGDNERIISVPLCKHHLTVLEEDHYNLDL